MAKNRSGAGCSSLSQTLPDLQLPRALSAEGTLPHSAAMDQRVPSQTVQC